MGRRRIGFPSCRWRRRREGGEEGLRESLGSTRTLSTLSEPLSLLFETKEKLVLLTLLLFCLLQGSRHHGLASKESISLSNVDGLASRFPLPLSSSLPRIRTQRSPLPRPHRSSRLPQHRSYRMDSSSSHSSTFLPQLRRLPIHPHPSSPRRLLRSLPPQRRPSVDAHPRRKELLDVQQREWSTGRRRRRVLGTWSLSFSALRFGVSHVSHVGVRGCSSSDFAVRSVPCFDRWIAQLARFGIEGGSGEVEHARWVADDEGRRRRRCDDVGWAGVWVRIWVGEEVEEREFVGGEEVEFARPETTRRSQRQRRTRLRLRDVHRTSRRELSLRRRRRILPFLPLHLPVPQRSRLRGRPLERKLRRLLRHQRCQRFDSRALGFDGGRTVGFASDGSGQHSSDGRGCGRRLVQHQLSFLLDDSHLPASLSRILVGVPVGRYFASNGSGSLHRVGSFVVRVEQRILNLSSRHGESHEPLLHGQRFVVVQSLRYHQPYPGPRIRSFARRSLPERKRSRPQPKLLLPRRLSSSELLSSTRSSPISLLQLQTTHRSTRTRPSRFLLGSLPPSPHLVEEETLLLRRLLSRSLSLHFLAQPRRTERNQLPCQFRSSRRTAHEPTANGEWIVESGSSRRRRRVEAASTEQWFEELDARYDASE
ncbi:hypothetical protein BDY24DRAFT_181339 [Mrakia frigida]|uniref:uncharacterized protein n=1 Tax=Mrakia frigida TaxID=29902 RepID=UPI003FCC0EE1